ncbi:MAG TPA: hypothetical protein VFJ16_01650 [Longimicrobium sp.]|nr:hypothetical protein [Longimicrobium sp.]
MRKVQLNLDTLAVESFDTSSAALKSRGTVQGHWSQVGTCDAFVGTCQYGGTCGNGCATKGCTTIQCV